MDWHTYFLYDEVSGLLSWKNSTGRIKAGDKAGCFCKSSGYMVVRLKYKLYGVHRVVWEMSHPESPLLPGDEIDHIDHNRLNNKACNLRKVSHKANMMNQSLMKNNKSGVNGVFWDKRALKWRADIRVAGKNVYLGSFKDLTEAAAARKAAELEYKYHHNHGV